MRALLLISLLSCAGMALTEPRLLALSVGGHALHAE
jgi:hypothetical protein